MLELCNYIYQNYPKMTQMFPRWKLLSLLDRNEDKIVYIEEDINGTKKFLGSALYIKLTDLTFAKFKLGFVDTTNPNVINELLQENGKNIFIVYAIANGFRTIRKGLCILIQKENPKTVTWYEPDRSILHSFKIKGEILCKN